MVFKQFYLGCLAHASYLIGSNGEAAVVDPQRDVEQYLQEAGQHNLTIRHVIETHFHADFVSGHLELARKTGAKIYYGSKARPAYEFVPVHDGDSIRLGSVLLRFLETPGHTPESISLVVIDEEKSAEPDAVLTGDALFIGDVGRPDLLGAAMSAQELAAMLYDSLHQKLLKLPDATKVFPAHGAGSLCGRNISSDTSSTIGRERAFNYALKPMSREDFVRMMTADLPEAPPYFKLDAAINREGPALREKMRAPRPISAIEVQNKQREGVFVLDTRPSPQYGSGHVPGSIHIGLSGQFASWAGTLIPLETPLILVAENAEAVEEATNRLARVGLDTVVGHLDGGVLAWSEAGLPIATCEQIGVDELRARLQENPNLKLIDVRRPGEWQNGHVDRATHLPLNHLVENLAGLDHDQPLAVVCAGGFRSSIASSLLERNGFRNFSNVVGGMTAWTSAKLPVV